MATTGTPVTAVGSGGEQDHVPVVLVGAGDIANCDITPGSGAMATARLLDRIPGTVFTVGDHAYPSGTGKQLQDCYEPSWGLHKARTRPRPVGACPRAPCLRTPSCAWLR